MSNVFTITISDDGEELERVFIREQYGADALAESIGKHVARFRGEIFASGKITISVTREDDPTVAELAPSGSYGGGYDDDIL